MEQRVRYGMVGGGMDGFIGEVHRKAVNFDPRAALVAGCFSRNPQKNLMTGEVWHLDKQRVYPNYLAMAEAESAREDGIDFVSITTSNETHFEIAKCFLERGIHVVCEKPMCLSVQEAEELCRLAEENHLLFAVTHTYTGYVMSKVMREMIQQGKIGKIVSVNAEYAQDWLLDELAPNMAPVNPSIWKTNPRFAGQSNCVADIGTHVANYVHFATGLKMRRLLATVDRFGHALELNANILVEYENGVRGAYWCSQIASGHLNGLRVRVYGDQGSLEWDQEQPEVLRYAPKGEAVRILARGAGYLGKANDQSRIPAGHPEGLTIAIANIYRNFIHALLALREGGDPARYEFPTAQDGLDGIKFVQAVLQSAKNNSSWVELE